VIEVLALAWTLTTRRSGLPGEVRAGSVRGRAGARNADGTPGHSDAATGHVITEENILMPGWGLSCHSGYPLPTAMDAVLSAGDSHAAIIWPVADGCTAANVRPPDSLRF
jgi:hypothetical protein